MGDKGAHHDQNPSYAATGTGSDRATFAAALAIARTFSAHIDALHLRFDPAAVARSAGVGSGGGGALIESLVRQLEHDASQREAEAHRIFSEFYTREKLPLVDTPGNAGTGPSVQWHVASSQEPRWLAAFGHECRPNCRFARRP
jgi:hypothetical protein